VLGRGGMAVVYRVSDGDGGRELALKQLQVSEMRENRTAVQQFTSAVWPSAGGVPQRVQLLTASSNGELRYVGVVVSSALSSRPVNQSLLIAMADYFIATGDTAGMPV
jgi:hypothetical protein